MRGTIVPDDSLAIAIVGSRRGTPYGEQVAHRLAADLAAAGVTIVSGLARGIDTAAHRGALSAGGRTLAVLGCGIDRVYPPENEALARAVAASGAVVSQFPDGTRPLSWNFPERNRTIAGLALGVVVVEAAERSGALITAGLAADLGREVFAVPGRVTSPVSEGANRLIQDGAKLVQKWTDIVQELSEPWRSAVRQPPGEPAEHGRPGPDSEEGRVLGLLSPDEPRHIDDLLLQGFLSPGRLSATLVALEIAGWARRLAGQRWVATDARMRRR